MKKRQIVFMGATPICPVLKVARALKATKKYEIVWVGFSELKESFAKETFDEVLILELDRSVSLKALFYFLKKLTKKETYVFFRRLKELNPYITQIHSASHISLLSFLLMRKRPKVIYLNDIWHYFIRKKLSLKKGSGRMQNINLLIEKFFLKRADGVINKYMPGALGPLRSKVKCPTIDLLPNCLDEFIVPPKKKFLDHNNDIHIAYAGTTWAHWEGHASFKDMVEKIVNQGIHLHFYPSTITKETEEILREIEKKNRFFHLYPHQDLDKINKEISKYDYGIHLDFCDDTTRPEFFKTAVAAKIFGYFEAGLPVIINNQWKGMCKIIEENKMGKGISYKDLGNLRKVISDFKYPSVKNIKKVQDKFKLSKKIKDLEKFYEEVHNKLCGT